MDTQKRCTSLPQTSAHVAPSTLCSCQKAWVAAPHCRPILLCAGARFTVHAACSTGVNSHFLGSSQRVGYFGFLPSHTQLLRWPQLVFKGADF